MSPHSAESESIVVSLFSCDLAYVYRVPPAGTVCCRQNKVVFRLLDWCDVHPVPCDPK